MDTWGGLRGHERSQVAVGRPTGPWAGTGSDGQAQEFSASDGWVYGTMRGARKQLGTIWGNGRGAEAFRRYVTQLAAREQLLHT